MNKTKITLIAALILAVIAGYFLVTKSDTTLDKSLRDFSVKDTASITRIFMSDKSDRSILLERESTGVWSMNKDFRAHPENINTFLLTVSNLTVREPVARAAHNNILTLLSARSVKVEIYQNSHRLKIGQYHFFPYEKLAKTYYIGDATMDNIGTYALMEGSDSPVVLYMPGLRGYVATRFSTAETDWREHTVFNKKLPEIDFITVEFPEQAEESYKVINKNNEALELIRMIDNKILTAYDTLQLMAFVNAFRNIRYEALFNDMEVRKKDSISGVTPMHIITLQAKDGTVQDVKTFPRMLPEPEIDVFDGSVITYDRDRMYAYINNDADFVLIQYFVFDKILRPLSSFTMGRKE
ncbi:MAG: DUF4340 domain-containing protein [Lentimicrobium sp.]|nr:DUF4340 domain-containing protein [Lentimicrobium sp.]